ncbi:hypothetical protein FOTG_18609 [Fusarium oxysporum f. sp. vasinfectum 25433]|uniref:Uncharacterized protein n=1 Tax=Fusarium oxysporum f. sp. vasinfectum 25433 TaxID=1089449 RepID=X0KVV6_FUSOX|nr:hypothetical protein FOTG_18609 [Fusarium oxysporum f. sp. vasinfectum 25433]
MLSVVEVMLPRLPAFLSLRCLTLRSSLTSLGNTSPLPSMPSLLTSSPSRGQNKPPTGILFPALVPAMVSLPINKRLLTSTTTPVKPWATALFLGMTHSPRVPSSGPITLLLKATTVRTLYGYY